MLGDGEGYIWLANHFNGLDKFNIKTEQFTHIRHDKNNPASLVNDSLHILFFDRQHYLWIGTHIGLSRMDTKTGICTNYINDPNDSLSIGKGHINSIAQDKNDNIWIGTDVDVYALDTKTGKFQRYIMGSGQITNLCVDETGKIWTAGVGGLYFFDKEKNSFKKFTTQRKHYQNKQGTECRKNIQCDSGSTTYDWNMVKKFQVKRWPFVPGRVKGLLLI